MAHRYGRLVKVRVRDGALVGFRWQGVEYRVAEVLATWHLRDRWWVPLEESDLRRAESDRTYYRVRRTDEQLFDLYRDIVSGLQVLDVAHDERSRAPSPARARGMRGT